VIDRHVPIVARNVPVQLVDRARLAAGVVEPDCVVYAVTDDDSPIRIAGARHPDAQPDGPAVVPLLALYTKWLAAGVGDGEDVDVELRRASLRGVVLERKVALDSVPGARKTNREILDDVERSVRMDGEQRIEVADADRAPLRARGAGEREEEEECFADR
jgi:hypothetical protein